MCAQCCSNTRMYCRVANWRAGRRWGALWGAAPMRAAQPLALPVSAPGQAWGAWGRAGKACS
jgi:hypothetical protein